jgi:hypothetical protein
VLIAAAGSVVGTAAAAQPQHGTPPPSTVPTTLPPTTLAPTTVAPTTAVPTTLPTTTTVVTTTTAPPPPTTSEPPIQEPTTTTTAPPTSEVPPTTAAPDDDPDGGDRDTPIGVLVPQSGSGPSSATGAVADAPAVGGGVDDVFDGEIALPSAEWLFSDGRALISPPQPGDSDTRPLWLAILFGLAAGIGLTATASVVVNNLHREHPES